MQTPARQECRYFYGDYYRGRDHEECRLLKDATPPQIWKPALCFTCPVPGILRANACEHMTLRGEVHRPFFILKPRVRVKAYCKKTEQVVDEPRIGCGECHDLPDVFKSDE
ncbi:MAG: hypothetical protein MAG431_00975 [Chloroflexi bacterium]|nr:hypothetical protein [Chloroflexota bacterium]